MILRPIQAMCLGLFALAVSTLPARAEGAPARPPIEHFFESPGFSGALLSPNAKYLAVRVGAKEMRERLAVVDLTDNSIKVVGHFMDADIGKFQWVNNDRLLFDTTDRKVGPGDARYAPGLYAVNRDGKEFRQLASRSGKTPSVAANRRLLPWHTFMLPQAGPQDSEFVYVRSVKFSGPNKPEHVTLLRLNTLNGSTRSVDRPGDTLFWLLDAKGEPRLSATLDEDKVIYHHRDAANEKWRQLAKFDAYTGDAGFTPVGFGPEGKLYVNASNGRDKTALHTLDLATGQLSKEPLVALADFDFRGNLVSDNAKLLGIQYLTDAEGTVWFDPGMKQLQATIDTLLPTTVNVVSVAPRPETPWVLVKSSSDLQPPVFRLFHTEKKVFNKIGEAYARIQAAQMGSRELVRYKARDGLDIPAWLTLPPGGMRKGLPLVMMVHGGPYSRGASWAWKPEIQFLASRGYAVIEPEFRGSTGFGSKHFRAGWKQWGLAMQDDIADGAKWAIAQGIADPKRICIAGASYGGYATLMGLVNDTDLYKCGINWVGVTDINLLYTGHWSFDDDSSEGWKQYGMPLLIGDPVKDAAQLKATSPLEQAARIKQPLLLAYGGSDLRVPPYHGTRFRDAVKQTNPDVEWVLYEDEGHGWSLPKNRIDFWTRVEKFLDRNIGK